MDPLFELGASDVIPEEFETSVEIFTRVMTRYLVPRSDIERFTAEVRAEGYEMLRASPVRGVPLRALSRQLPGMDVSVLSVELGSDLEGRTLEESGLRRRHGLTVVAIGRGEEVTANPDGGMRLNAGDVAYVFGRRSDIAAKTWLFSGRRRPGDEDVPEDA
jgi:CPA2 family monovalent cation:H+ antiporter-2